MKTGPHNSGLKQTKPFIIGNYIEIYMLYSKSGSFYSASRIQFRGVTWPKVEPYLCQFVLEEYFNVALQERKREYYNQL